MIIEDKILGFWIPGPFEILIIIVFAVISISIIVVFLRLLLRNKKENIKLRLEVGKLAEEIEKVRKQKDTEKGNSSKDF